MTDPTEQTVLEALHARPSFDKTTLSALRTLGINPSMPVSRLAEDLAIAARVRACEFEPHAYGSRIGAVVTGSALKLNYADSLLSYLLRGRPAVTGHQYEFRDGHFVDTWNPGTDDTSEPLEPFAWWELILIDAGLCGCTATNLVGAAMANYLADPRHHPDGWDLATELIAALADHAGFCEHGTSINAAWITPAGIRWLELYAEVQR